MASDHYFSPQPESEFRPRKLTVSLLGRVRSLTTAGGVFSPDRIDLGTQTLLTHVPPPPPDGQLLDLGCGWGPIALTMALQSPKATVWAVDVNERALELTRQNAQALGARNVRACRPEEVPAELRFRTIWSNPPIRVGKNELHDLLTSWLPRLEERRDGYLVVQRNLGADSLHRWLEASLPKGFSTTRNATSKGYRVLRVRNNQAG